MIGSVGSVVRILSDPVSGHDARRAAQQELSRPEYHRDDPSALTRATDWILDQLGRLGGASVGQSALFVLAVILVAAVLLMIARAGRPARGHRPATAGADPLRPATSRDHAEAAEEFARNGQYAQALQEWLRATVRTLEDRGVLNPRPGRTADDIARTAGAQLPQAAVVLRTATDAFDAIWFGARPANAADAAAGRDAAVAVGLARIQPGPVEAPQYAIPQ